jgi:hypothetical protein
VPCETWIHTKQELRKFKQKNDSSCDNYSFCTHKSTEQYTDSRKTQPTKEIETQLLNVGTRRLAILPRDFTKLHAKGVWNPPAWRKDRPDFFIRPQLTLYPSISPLSFIQSGYLCNKSFKQGQEI